ncbi:MAG: DUF2784 domain-containing protein [Candidatus Hydrogenedentes bacterium]|nr:DUF2784 domain-containing protein [Candidatus Hydrogenedentota bacterium]
MTAYRFLDAAFLLFHSALIVFVAFGWVWKRTRRIHLATVGVVGLSWFGLGLIYGLGFCPCTEWHWRVRERLGDTLLPNSYIKFLLDTLTGLDWNAAVVDGSTFCVFLIATLLSVLLNRRDMRERIR